MADSSLVKLNFIVDIDWVKWQSRLVKITKTLRKKPIRLLTGLVDYSSNQFQERRIFCRKALISLALLYTIK